ncbi:MAG: hypothetical protein LLG20_18360 [Acidobacteriales bacterium]|nr:hypothetical protein [Terriglobales bacterium]
MERAAELLEARAEEIEDEPGEFYRGVRNNLRAMAAAIRAEAAKLPSCDSEQPKPTTDEALRDAESQGRSKC